MVAYYLYSSSPLLRAARREAVRESPAVSRRHGSVGAATRRPSGNISFKKLDKLPFGWAIACPNRLPRDLGGRDFSQRLGVQTWLDIANEYDRHVPASSLMTEDVIGALVGPPAVGAGSPR